MEEADYDELPLQLERGDLLVLTSDGTTDAENPGGELYDSVRLVESIRRHAAENPAAFVRKLHSDIADFSSGTVMNDDLTILALKRGR